MRLTLIALIVFFVVGCAPTGGPPEPKQEVYKPVFDWNPAESATPGSANVIFAIVGGEYATDEEYFVVYPFTTFRDNMRNDFNELLTARGFTTTGPFDLRDEMTYPDKKQCDLILEPKFDIKLELPKLSNKQHTVFLGDPYFTLNGMASISGRVTFSIVESLTGTRMWNKSVAIEPVSFSWNGTERYPVAQKMVYLRTTVALQNACALELEKVYNKALAKAWLYLDPEEMAIVKQQAMEVKEKARFGAD